MEIKVCVNVDQLIFIYISITTKIPIFLGSSLIFAWFGFYEGHDYQGFPPVHLGNLFPHSLVLFSYFFFTMGKKIVLDRARSEKPRGFHIFRVITWYEGEASSFFNVDIDSLRSSCNFPHGTIFRVLGSNLREDFLSSSWVCFYEFPFTISRSFLFPSLIS